MEFASWGLCAPFAFTYGVAMASVGVIDVLLGCFVIACDAANGMGLFVAIIVLVTIDAAFNGTPVVDDFAGGLV